ncbi:sulfolipid-1 biosynthesis phthioceranic/hydroxyphthioceranic acid synthase [Candidatus Mycobacterium wuenschmannii]|uniref:Sulfolipid-1 biosynthesis phthioceranic/hydroxyphthioceranic acid synthase n=1 Tax=Candidatus Mycobacterium wuenschmannii TaxID=3027808 RepID=A0ABY8W8Q7_9MYCO|nr:sulfolipid-1 biosynthesis phthioceranic/hydroxyphthioceranic acid synthase [Candidatus Mycobacterium wuenschmannii]WIM90159.1 sulfolipid-1 biosynthesis phthioceranic/hydroxyphthioceranic acid synthase [Candidatus Mycobacterium wuenschmannii]
MACRLPGGIDSPERLWDALLRGDDLITEIPTERWDAESRYDPERGVPGRSVTKWGGFLDDVAGFDSEFFGISDREATAIDPQHRLLLETSWEAIQHGGVDPATLADSATGVFVGLAHDDYTLVTGDAGALEEPYGYTGTAFSMASGRISYTLGLSGPAVTMDTACSSGLVTVHMACRSLHEGESDLALAGGCMLMLEPRLNASMSAIGMLSSTGRCQSFDTKANGFVRAEGSAMVLLKRLPDAIRDGDRVLAVIRGTATNQDGRSDTITMPSMDAQVAAYRSALKASGVEAASIGMVEAHGTGTPVGDPIEFRGLAEVYGVDGPCALASVKSNLGHTESAAGTVGLIKAILAVQHGAIPRMLHFTELPEDLARIDTNLFVPQDLTAWPGDGTGPRRAAVSSYGMSGTNAHAIIEQAADATSATAERNGVAVDSVTREPLLVPVSATSVDALRSTAERLADWVDRHAEDVTLRDAAYTLARRRAHGPVRTAVLAADLPELAAELRDIAGGDLPYQPALGDDDRGPVWVFSGQGSQWAEMGAELLSGEPVFAATIARLEPLIAEESGFSVTEAMTSVETVTGIDRVQPTIFAMQVALAATMTSYGVVPGAVIGHSLGEVAAAVVAGALSLEDGVRVICRRARLCLRLAGGGAMASVELPAQQVLSQLADRGINDVVVAVVASPTSTVIGGATAPVRDLVAGWEARDVMAREVAVDVASHSPQVDPILDELTEVLADLEPMSPTIPYYSATSIDPRDEPYCDADYWVENLRQMVRFGAAVQAALEDGYRVFAELSPHPLLTRAVEQTARHLETPAAALAGMRRQQPMPHGLRGLLADLYAAGAALDFAALYPTGRLVDAPLPTWTHRRLILTPRESPGAGGASVAVHPLLGPHVRLQEEPERHVWQSGVGTAGSPWLSDHQINRVAALPGAAYCEMALAGARAVFGESGEVRDIRFEQMLLLDADTTVGAVATLETPTAATFSVESNTEGTHTRWASAVLAAIDDDRPPAHDLPALRAAHTVRMDGADVREAFDRRGIQFGAAFTGLAAVHTGDGAGATIFAEIGLPNSVRTGQNAFGVHPALLDACFQSVAAHPGARHIGNGGLLLPLGVRRLRQYGPTRDARYCYARVTASGTCLDADLDLVDAHGTVLLTARGLQMGTGVSESAHRDRLLGESLLTIEWQPRSLPASDPAAAGNWLLVNTSDDADPLTTSLGDTIAVRAGDVTSVTWSPRSAHPRIAEQLAHCLRAHEFAGVVVVTPPRRGVTDEQSLTEGREQVRHLVRIARELTELPGSSPRLFVVTRRAQLVVPHGALNLEQAGLRGLLRVVGAENPHLRVTQIDADDDTPADELARELLSGADEDETAWRGGQWYAARLRPGPLRPDERLPRLVEHAEAGVRLRVRVPGDLETLERVAFDRVPPGRGQIEVAVTASSLNFADVLMAMGRFPTIDEREPELGVDFAGVVTAVGPGVADHEVGDRVGGFSRNGCWATFVTCDARVAVTLPVGLSDHQAVAVSTGHATAWYGLHDQARIAAGDRVLIHSATGGVGQAAVAIARAAGAEIFATAGSAQRRELLHRMGIDHVYDSRSTDFAELIRRDTDGYGVDIVLNSLTGAAQRAGFELLADGGRFVEIGKRDVYANARLGMYPFRRNLAFHYVDLALMSETHPQRIGKLLGTVFHRVADGDLPPAEFTPLPFGDAATAIRMMSAAEHTGKLVLDVPRTGVSSALIPPADARPFRADGAYVVTGGLGGLGLFLAEEMAAAGCGRIVLSSRSGPDAAAQQAIDRIRATGADVVVEPGDVTARDTAQRLVLAATATGLPVRGVLHAAAVVEDATLTNISDDLIDRDWAPKVYGAWQLHRATIGQPLDWFCSFSSAAALLGSRGQGAYAAANSWLDTFTHWRRAQGLPSSAIAWGAWDKIGRGAGLAETGDTTMIAPQEGAYAFQSLLRHDRAYTGYISIAGTPWLTALAQRSRFAEALQSADQSATEAGKFRGELEELPTDEWPNRLRRLVSEQVSLILRRSVDPNRSLAEYGLDSLGNLELRTRIETETGVRISSYHITTVRGLAGHLCDELSDLEAMPA